MKKLVLLLSALIMGLVLVSCEVTLTPIGDYVDVTASTNTMTIEAGNSQEFNLTIDATENIVDDSISYIVYDSDNDWVPLSGISLAVANFNSMDTTILAEISVESNTTPGVYTMDIYADGILITDYTTVTITVTGTPATITSVTNAAVVAGATTTTAAVIAENGNTVSVSDLSVSIANDLVGVAPTATVSSYTSGVATISINAANATAGTYTGTLTLGTGATADTETFTVTVTAASTILTEKTFTLYNPYAQDTYNSAYNLVKGEEVAASLAADNTHMEYASSDSAVADLAVDNTFDIRASKIVTELTSINGGFFYEVTASDYDNATDVSLATLCAGINFVDNEAIEFGVGSIYAMKLANNRGYAIIKITSIDEDATEGSTGNTGKMGIAYKFLGM